MRLAIVPALVTAVQTIRSSGLWCRFMLITGFWFKEIFEVIYSAGNEPYLSRNLSVFHNKVNELALRLEITLGINANCFRSR